MHSTVASVMTTKVIAATPSTPFHELVELLRRHRISALPVVDGHGRLAGIVSEADLLVKASYPPAPPTRGCWRRCATTPGSSRPTGARPERS